MSPRSPVPRRRSRDEDDDSDDSESINSSTPSSNKRRRLSGAHGEVSRSDEDRNHATANNSLERPSQDMASQALANSGAGPGGYKPGTIVRIKVTNFVTYTSAEFFPGPKLNMVIGPNGTGKSTLVCAICLGLGWGPQVRCLYSKTAEHTVLTRNSSSASRTREGPWGVCEAWLPRSHDRDRTCRCPKIPSKPSDLPDN